MSTEPDLKEQALTELTRAAQGIEDAKRAVEVAEAWRNSRILYWWLERRVVSAIEAGGATGLNRKRIYQIKNENS